MSDYAHSQGKGRNASFVTQDGVAIGGRPLPPMDLAVEMAQLAARFGVKPSANKDPLSDVEIEGGTVGLCATAVCPGCGRALVSALQCFLMRGVSDLGFCGRCRPLSAAGRVDHAAWVAARRGAAA